MTLIPKQKYIPSPAHAEALSLYHQVVSIANGGVSAAFQVSANRVAGYLAKVIADHGDGSFERVCRPDATTEQFFLFMPTDSAYQSEKKLFSDIRDHASNTIGDADLKASLASFVESHTFVYMPGLPSLSSGELLPKRWTKAGNWNNWPKIPLFINSWANAEPVACNIIQAWLKFSIDRLKYPNIKLGIVKI